MPGIFSKSNRPKLPGAYFNFDPSAAAVIAINGANTVAIPVIGNWGPENQAVVVTSFEQFKSIYGDDVDTQAYYAVLSAFLGENVDGRTGAGAVVVYRMVGSDGTYAGRNLSNGAVTALALRARYKGTRGLRITLTVKDAPEDGTKDVLEVRFDGSLVERYVYSPLLIAALAADITANSDWVVPTGTPVDGTALTAVTNVALTTADDGDTIVIGDWTAAMAALETIPFSVFIAYDLVESTPIRTALKAWAVGDEGAPGLNLRGKRFFVLTGGAQGESLATAIARADELRDPNFINMGVGTYVDPNYGVAGGSNLVGTRKLIARLGGILASRAEYQSITNARFAGVDISVGPTIAEQTSAFDEGVVVLGRDSHPTAPTHVSVGLTTWTLENATAAKPYLTYRQPKYVKTMHNLETEVTRHCETNVIGLTPVAESTRTALVGFVKGLLSQRQKLDVIQSGWTVGIDADPPPTADDEFIALAITLKFGRALEQVYFTVAIS